MPGVDELRICGPSCAHSSTLVHGTLVLLAAPVRDAAGDRPIVGIPQPVNGCFRFDRYQLHGMIGHETGGYLIWSGAQGRVSLNFSPDGVDAGYAIDFLQATGEPRGTGVTWYASESNQTPPRRTPSSPDARARPIRRNVLRRWWNRCATGRCRVHDPVGPGVRGRTHPGSDV